MHRGWIRVAAVAAAAGVLSAGPGPVAGQQAETDCTADERTANLDFTLEDIDGNAVALRDYAGRVILLDFWATWCAPCRFLIPGFVELYDEYGPQGFQVVGISVDDSVDELRPYAEELGMNYPVLVGRGRDDIQDAYGPLIGLPTAFIIDREGRVCMSHTGFAPKATFEEAIRALL